VLVVLSLWLFVSPVLHPLLRRVWGRLWRQGQRG
jgi:hypothetical protein